jgi:hypothetical protein
MQSWEEMIIEEFLMGKRTPNSSVFHINATIR